MGENNVLAPNRYDLNALTDTELLEYFKDAPISDILYLNEEHLKFLLEFIDIKEKILSLNAKYLNVNSLFIDFINKLNEELFNIFISEDIIPLIERSSKKFIIIQALFSINNEGLLKCLETSIITKYLVDHFDTFNPVIDNLSEEIVIIIFHYILKNDITKIDNITQLSAQNQLAIIRDIGVCQFYKLINNKNIFENLDENVITLLIEDNPFFSYFANLPRDKMISLLEQNIILPRIFSTNRHFIEKISSIKDPNQYRLLINHLNEVSYNNYYRRKWLFADRCIKYFEENKMEYNEREIKNYFIKDNYLPTHIYKELYDSSILEMAKEKKYDEQVSLISKSQNLLPEYYQFYLNYNNCDINTIDQNIYLKKQINQWSLTNGDITDLYYLLYEATTRRFQEILIDRYYKDIAYNFLVNLDSLINFMTSNWDLVKGAVEDIDSLKQRMEHYQKILAFPSMSRQEQLNLYYSFNPKVDYALEFYEDFALAKNLAYEDMNNAVFTPTKNERLVNNEISQQLNVNIYELKGEPFYAYIHVSLIKRSEARTKNNLWDNRIRSFLNDPISNIQFTTGSSLSLMSHLKLEALRSVEDYVTFGYSYLEPSRIAHVYHADSYSAYYHRGVGMNKKNELYTAKQLTDKTRRYSEILYQEVNNSVLDLSFRKNYAEFLPTYLICFNEVKEWDVLIAKRMNLPILLIHTDCYSCELDDYNDYNDDNEYITSLSETKKIMTYQTNKGVN